MSEELPDLSAGARKAIMQAKKFAQTYSHDFITTEHILLSILDHEARPTSVRVMSDMNIDIMGLKSFIIKNLQKYKGPDKPKLNDIELSGRAMKVLVYASSIATEMKTTLVDLDHLLLSILVSDSGTGNNLFKLKNIDVDHLYEVIFNTITPKSTKYKKPKQKSTSRKPVESGTNSAVKGPGSALEKYATNLTEQAKNGEIDPVIGRDFEVNSCIQILSRRTKNNPVLIGEAGVGKTAVVEGLALRISSGEAPMNLKDKNIYTLDLAQLVAGTIYRGQFEERLKDIITYVQSKDDIILFVDELHMLAGAGSSTGAMDASNILKPALARGKISCIGATTTQEYKEYIECDGALERRFQSIYVDEPDTDEVIEILKGIRHKYEDYHNVKYNARVLKEIVTLCNRYITDKNFPDKAIDILDEMGAKKRVAKYLDTSIDIIDEELATVIEHKKEAVTNQQFDVAVALRERETELNKEKLQTLKELENELTSKPLQITVEDIRELISSKCSVPLAALEEDEATTLSKLAVTVKRKVIGQVQGVDRICNAIKRNRAGVSDPNKPICSLMFLGPTGVGKTHLARTLGDMLFDNANFKQFDMSEYAESHSISKLIGSPPGYVGYGDGGKLTEYVRRNPYCVLLFDEIEKAHVDIVQVFLQILEYGMLTDSDGLEVNFKNTIVIMTSNVGAHMFDKKPSVGFGVSSSTEETVLDELKKMYAPEFVNRLDEVVVFGKLTEGDLHKIVKILINNVKRTLKGNNKTTLVIDPEVNNYILSLNTEISYGARPLKRLITEYIETPLAEFIIDNNLIKCKKIYVDMIDDKITFNT